MKFGSVFAGIGGFDLGLGRAGMECAWQIEINDDATNILEKHWPDVVRCRDVLEFDGSERRWGIDVLCGGFPCQDVSLCGKKAWLAGDQSSLFWQFLRVAEETGPRWIIVESVGGLLTGNSGRDFAVVLCALGECGYVCSYRFFDAQYFGVPQVRERVFVVGHLGQWEHPARVLFDAESLRERDRESGAERDRVAREVNEGTPFVFQTRIARCKRGLPTSILPTLTSYEGAGIHSDSKPHVVTKDGIRRLTALEHERAMGFPDRWTAGLEDRTRRMLLGNAVVPNVAEWIARRIVQIDPPENNSPNS